MLLFGVFVTIHFLRHKSMLVSVPTCESGAKVRNHFIIILFNTDRWTLINETANELDAPLSYINELLSTYMTSLVINKHFVRQSYIFYMTNLTIYYMTNLTIYILMVNLTKFKVTNYVIFYILGYLETKCNIITIGILFWLIAFKMRNQAFFIQWITYAFDASSFNLLPSFYYRIFLSYYRIESSATLSGWEDLADEPQLVDYLV